MYIHAHVHVAEGARIIGQRGKANARDYGSLGGISSLLRRAVRANR